MAIDPAPAPVTGRAPSDAVIDVRGLVKSFGTTLVLDQLDLDVVPGEVHGLLGPNGAGKTTTLRILLGLLRSDAGTVRLLGGDPWHDAAALHHRLAYVPGDVTLWPNLTGGEVIDMLGRMRGGLDRTRRDDLIARFDLDPTKKGRTYSKGNRQKVALVAALASDVELLLLDEPTAGLDPLMDATFRDYIATFRADGRTVLLSSHILSEVEALCDRVSIIRQGVVVESGTMAELRHLTRTSVVAEVDVVPAGLDHLPGVHDVVVDGGRVTASVESHGLSPLMASLGSGGLTCLTTAPPTLEELFLRHYREALPEAAPGPDAQDSPGSHRRHVKPQGRRSA
ncbi:MAG TPA: ABC transporter ATP-binding protein [Motilibacterales bacterium]|nr:ABC transporter ATP-binding protein [Motilibacterales bacterium]